MKTHHTANNRINLVDVLRGVAIMGIILLHTIEHFNFYSFPDTTNQTALLNFTDKAIWDSMFFTFGGKAYAIFALLFGFSFFVQDENQRLKGNEFRLRFLWRMILLFLFGTINAMFFTGEILVMYSLLSITLILVCRLPNKVVFWIALFCIIQPIEWGRFLYALFHPEYVKPASMVNYYFNEAFKVQSNGTFLETVQMNLWEGQLANFAYAWEYGRIFQTIALFMFGMLAGRIGIFKESEKNLRTWLFILTGALIGYFSLTGLNNLLPDYITSKVAISSLNIILQSLANCCFMLVLVAIITLTFYTTSLKKIWMKLAPYGKMSLTNYITQSIIGSLLFYNWGFGLDKYLGITASFFVGNLLFILQYSFCRWWLKTHSHGPLEFLWKKGTWIDKH